MRDAEHVVVGARAHGLGDVGAGADVAHHRDLLLVGDVLPGQRVAELVGPKTAATFSLSIRSLMFWIDFGGAELSSRTTSVSFGPARRQRR
jgi:hypothetical protein